MKKIIDFFDNTPVTRLISSILILAMAFIMVMNVILRYVFHFSFNWADEIIRYLCIYMSFLGIASAWKYGTHIGVTLFVEHVMPKGIRKYIRLLQDIISIFFLAVTVYFGFILVERIIASNQLSPALKVPMWAIYGIVPITSILGIIQLLIGIFRHHSYENVRE